MKKFFLAAFLFCTGCAHQGQIDHVVIIWLKNPDDAAARQQVIDRSYTFTKIPGITKVEAGPMMPSDHMGVDSTFDVGVIMTFDSEKSLRSYSQNPIHMQAVKEVLTPLAAKFVVYDFPVK